MKGSVVGLIPVKGSSDRVKQKNLRDFAGLIDGSFIYNSA